MLRWITHKLKERKALQQQQARVALAAFRHRLHKPDFDLVNRHFGKPISEPLRELYCDSAELDRDCVEKKFGPSDDDGLFVAWYIPLDEQAYSEQWHYGDGCLDFADDGTGSRLTVDPTDDAAEIFFFQHEDQTLHPTGVKIRDFLNLGDD